MLPCATPTGRRPTMTSRYDLHTHSLYSDGAAHPAELVALARERGVQVLALTDHDSTEGLAAAACAATACGLTLVPGVEVSASWQNQTVHIVGLDVDAAHAPLQQGLGGLRAFRNRRAEEIGRRLEKARIADALAGAARLAHGGCVTRTHFARFLVERGHARNLAHAFRLFLARGRTGYVPGQWAALAEAVAWIRGAGGVAVIAHPGRYRLGAGKLRRLIAEFRECGGTAIEVVCSAHNPDVTRQFARLAREFGLLASAGSDYHGPGCGWADLGRIAPLPEGCAPVWQVWEGRQMVAPAARGLTPV